MKARASYVAVFEKDPEVNGYTVFFPDLPGCITEGDDYNQAIKMAKEALELHLYSMEKDEEKLPVATDPENIELEHGQFVTLIEADMILTRMEMENQKVSKNVSLPKWLETLGTENKINFSQTLENALYEKLGIERLANTKR